MSQRTQIRQRRRPPHLHSGLPDGPTGSAHRAAPSQSRKTVRPPSPLSSTASAVIARLPSPGADGRSQLFDTILEKVWEETPPRLRDLEEGWRARRRVLGDITARGDYGAVADEDRRYKGKAITCQEQEATYSDSPASMRQYRYRNQHGPSNTHPRVADIPDGRPRRTLIVPPATPHPTGVRFDLSFPSALPTPPSTPPTPPKVLDEPPSVSPPRSRPPAPLPPNSPSMSHRPRLGPGTHRPGFNSLLPEHPHSIPTFDYTRRFARETRSPPDSAGNKAKLSLTEPPTFKRILAHPLPPTPHPIPILSSGKETIYIPSNSTFELTLQFRGRGIRILTGGEGLIIDENATERSLCVVERESWSTSEKKEWKMVYELVEGFKRRTPRAKFFDPLGHLTITCSSPPDIILSFHLDSSGTSSGPSDVGGHPISAARGKSKEDCTLKVRLTYSKITEEMRIDTSHVFPPRGKRREKLRTKRIVPLQLSLTEHYRRPLPAQDRDIDTEEAGLNVRKCAQILGVQVVKMDGWAEEEKEAVRRLWTLRKIWGMGVWDDMSDSRAGSAT